MESRNPNRRPPIWLLPNLLSLDAPVVAVLWQGLLAVQTGLPLQITGRLVLGLTVWMIYIADRLLDVRDAQTVPQTPRHRFYRDHRGLAIVLLAAIALADAVLVVFDLRPAVFNAGLIAAAGVVVYLAVLHRTVRVLIPKELLVALLFTIGTFVVAWSSARHPVPELGLYALAFFALCLANLIAIERWESREVRGARSWGGHWITVALCRSFPVWLSILIVLCLGNGSVLWYRTIALSALAILGLLFTGERISIDARRVLVDAAMLTPVFFLR